MAVYHLAATITGDNGLFIEARVPVELGIRDAGQDYATRAIGLSYMQSLQNALNAELKQVPRSVWTLPDQPERHHLRANLADIRRQLEALEETLREASEERTTARPR